MEKISKKFIYLNIPILLQLLVVVLRFLRKFYAETPFGIALLIQIPRDLVRILTVIAFCFNERVIKELTDIIGCNTNNPKAKNVLEIKELLPENNDNVNPEQSQRQSWYESSFEDILES